MLHLNARTDFSFLRGFGSPEQWTKRASEIKAPAIGIADYCSTWGFIPFSKIGMPVIYGVQLPVVEALTKDVRHALVSILGDPVELYHLTTLAHEQVYYRPRVTWAQVNALKKCVVICDQISSEDLQYCQHHYLGLHPKMTLTKRFMSEMRCVPAQGAVYPSIADKPAYDVIQRIAHEPNPGYHAMSWAEFCAHMRDIPVSTEHLDELGQRLIGQNLKRADMVRFAVEKPLIELALAGAERIGVKLTDAYMDRLNYELDVVYEKGFADYFLLVSDLVTWARQRMLVGPGRGSSGGSLLCYLLGITMVDPIKHGTLFERFIDITRADLPDIDIDFPDNRREEVFEYLRQKYGPERVARLGTVSYFGGKSALNDTAKALGLDLGVARGIGKLTEAPHGASFPLKRVFKDFVEIDDTNRRLLIAERIEGHARHSGVHAAGVVITNDDMRNYASIKGGVACLDLTMAEQIGMLKVDALGLRTLTVINDCVQRVGCDVFGQPLDDKKTLDLINSGRLTGIFQFEGQAVKTLAGQALVGSFEDLCHITSLARPGPLMGGAAEAWVRRKNGQDAYTIEPALQEILGPTLGTIIYQEQAMAIVRDVAGFSPVDVNGFRRAVGKKDPEKLNSYRAQFLATAKCKDPVKLWDEMCEFGSYAFNKSHAVAYSMISYASAFLKAHYPLEFALSALMHSTDEDQAKTLLRELRSEGYEYVAFDPDLSDVTWSVINGKLYGGYTSVRGIGQKTAEAIIKMRTDENWKTKLTETQRKRILTPYNTPWHDVTYFKDRYRDVYADPNGYRSSWCKAGISGKVSEIQEVYEKGSYALLGRIVKVMRKDANDQERVNRRGGRKFGSDTFFYNIILQDDSGEIGLTINRFKAEGYSWLEADHGGDYFVRGTVSETGRRWMFADLIVRMNDNEK